MLAERVPAGLLQRIRRQPEVQAPQQARPLQKIVEDFSANNTTKLLAAERAFQVETLHRFIPQAREDRPLFTNDHVIFPANPGGNDVVSGQMYMLPYEAQRTAQGDLARQLYTEFQRTKREHSGNPDATTQPLFSPRIIAAAGGLAKERKRIYAEVDGLSDAELIAFEHRTANRERKLARQLPDASHLIDQAMCADEIVKSYLDKKREKAIAILSDVSDMHVIIRNMKSHIDRQPLGRRERQDVYNDLAGLMAAHEDIMNGRGGQTAYHERMSEIEEEMAEKRRQIHEKAASISLSQISESLRTADRSAQLLMMRRLRGEQRDLFADAHEYDGMQFDVAAVKKDYTRSYLRQGGIFLGENTLAMGLGIITQWLAAKYGLPHVVSDVLSPALEAAMLTETVVGGYSEAKSIRTGFSVNVSAQVMHENTSRVTDNRLVQDTATAGGYFASTYGLDIPVWSGLFTLFHEVFGYNANQLLNFAGGGNLLGMASQQALTEIRRRKSGRYDDDKLFKIKDILVDNTGEVNNSGIALSQIGAGAIADAEANTDAVNTLEFPVVDGQEADSGTGTVARL